MYVSKTFTQSQPLRRDDAHTSLNPPQLSIGHYVLAAVQS